MGNLSLFRIISILFLSFYGVNNLYAQYFVSDTDPYNLKWKRIVDKKKGDIIFPDYIQNKAMQISFYRDTLTGVVSYNIPFKLRRFPISLHPTNMRSNGMVTYTPQRMELYTMPDRNNFSLPWLKQLIAHEYRHVAQLSNLNRGITKILSYVLGEQMLGLTAIVVPTYFYEGDAVAAETEFSMWGRGRQPSFNIALRAQFNEGGKISPRKYRLGTLNEYTPDSYLLGYYLTRYMTEKYGDDFWSKVLRFDARNPYLIDPTYFAYRKYANKTNTSQIIDSVVVQMREFWKEASSVPNSSEIIDTKVKSYTTYSHPLPINDSIVLAHKRDLDKAWRYVFININTGSEKFVRNTGELSSNPIMIGNDIYWCEIVPSLSWGQKNSSEVFTMNLSDNYKTTRPKRIKQAKNNLFFITQYEKEGFAGVHYDKINNPHIVFMDDKFREIKSYPIDGNDISFNGLSYDNITKTLYGAIVDDRGTSIVYFDKTSGKLLNVLPPNYGTITNITATDGKLYYTSIDSGKEEIHIFDLSENKEYQFTTSKYGSIASIPMKFSDSDSLMLMTTYTINGYAVATQKIDEAELKEHKWRKMPESILDYPFKKWDVPKLDTITISDIQLKNYESTKKVKKYNKTLNSVNIHSWIPFYLDVNEIIDERELIGGWGINLLSQNLLNSVVASAGYGYVEGQNLFKADIKYTGLPVHINADIEYGGGKQRTYNFIMLGNNRKNYLRVGADLSLPFNLSSCANNRFLTLKTSLNYYNSLLYEAIYPNNFINIGSNMNIPVFNNNIHNYRIKEGMFKSNVSLTYSNTLKSTLKDLNPKLGYVLQFNTTFNPTRNDFGKIYHIYGRGYFPGPFPHGSITLELAYQYQNKDKFNYSQTILFPRGADYIGTIKEMYATSIEYKVPVAYPNTGLGSLLNFQRISAGAFFDYAKFSIINSIKSDYRNCFGATLFFDVNIFGIKNLFNIELSAYKPNDSKKVSFGVSLDVSI